MALRMSLAMATPSAIQHLITTHSPASASASTSTIPESQHHVNLTLQIAHNLRYQHSWTNVRIHSSSGLPQPLISGLPPRRLYTHPDEQIELLQNQKDAGLTGMPAVAPEREWVLPSQVREKWTLRRFGEVFDSVSSVPAEGDGDALFEAVNGTATAADANGVADDDVVEGDDCGVGDEGGEITTTNKWRANQPKRILLAILDDDSTIAYYIVHDGLVKPRQN